MDSNEEEYGTTFLKSDRNKPNENTDYEMKTTNQDKKRETNRRNKLSKVTFNNHNYVFLIQYLVFSRNK